MKILFMGTPDFAVPSLQTLLTENYHVIGVVTQPDRPKGRKRELTPPPVKVVAETHGIPVFQPERLRDDEAIQRILSLKPDLIVTAAYGQILPKIILELPKFGCINLHASLLPKYRGGAPIQHAIMNGETETGVTIMYMAEGLDTGDMIASVKVPITIHDDNGTMHDKLSLAGADLLKQTLPELINGNIKVIAQDHTQATIARNIRREDERIEWNQTAEQIYNHVRGLHPWPIAFTLWNGEVFKIWSCHVSQPNHQQLTETLPGTVMKMTDAGIEVMSGGGTILLTQIQPAGKKKMDAAQFIRSGKLEIGTVLGQ